MHSSRSHDAVIRVYDADGNVFAMHELASDSLNDLDFSPWDAGLERVSTESSRNGVATT